MNFWYYNEIIALILMMSLIFNSYENPKDPIESMKELNEIIDSIENEITREKVRNFIEYIILNKEIGFLFIFLFCSIPIINVLLLFKNINIMVK